MITLLITVLISGCSQVQKSSNQNKKKEIKVAISAEVNPPYLYTNKQNEFAGLDIDYLKLLEKSYHNTNLNMNLVKKNLIL